MVDAIELIRRDILKQAVQNAVSETLAEEVREIVAKEARRAFHDHENQFISIVQVTVAQAIAEMMEPVK